MVRDRRRSNVVKSAMIMMKLFIMISILILPVSALAEEGWGPGQDKWKFELGGYFPAIDTNLRVDATNAIAPLGDDLSLEDSLGFSDSDSIWRIDGYW